MIVVDASVVIELVLNLPSASAIHEKIFVRGHELHAPHLLDIEVMQVIRRYARAGRVDTNRGLEAVRQLTEFPVTRYPHTDALLQRVWALRHNLTAYDAVYVALAEALDAPLVTCDRFLASAPGHDAHVELVG
ncbi:MAG: type II toxin-antitoxin system VapC family toxin [Candidatus Acidiferrales bacterium]